MAANDEKGRVRTETPIHWGVTEECPRNGKMTSLSLDSCFIQTKAEVIVGQTIHVDLKNCLGSPLLLHGEIYYRLERLGFGVRFADLCEDEIEKLKEIIARASDAHSS
ncbi:MAG TPA: hypothetical protein VK619_13095 [Pyrinomonadaceae bacterium]|nr:hypothetical protein [Pyrinomonadaceae bacterium]